MWFKLFLVLRIPISAVCLLGYAMVARSWKPAGIEYLGLVVMLTPFVYLAVVSVKLILFRPGALRWAGWLLTLELAGAALLFAVSDYYRPRAANWLAFVKGGIATVGLVALLWTLPNALVLRSQWVRYLEPGIK